MSRVYLQFAQNGRNRVSIRNYATVRLCSTASRRFSCHKSDKSQRSGSPRRRNKFVRNGERRKDVRRTMPHLRRDRWLMTDAFLTQSSGSRISKNNEKRKRKFRNSKSKERLVRSPFYRQKTRRQQHLNTSAQCIKKHPPLLMINYSLLS